MFDSTCLRRTLAILTLLALSGGAFATNEIAPDGKTEIVADLPANQQFHNKGGSDGSGLCVFASITFAARWQNERSLTDLFDYMRAYPGGGYPSKVDKMIAQLCKEKGRPVPGYVQYSGSDPAIIELALKTGRLPCVTWGGNHMLCCEYLDGKQACLLDNNSPGVYKWLTRDQFLKGWRTGGGAWVVVLLAPPPPPVPASYECRLRGRGRIFPRIPFPRHPRPWRPFQPQGGRPSSSPDCVMPAGERVIGERWEWKHFASDPSRYYLFESGREVGCWDRDKEYFRPYDPDTDIWGDRGEAPIDPPRRNHFGMWMDRIPEGEHYQVNGKEACKETVFKLLTSGQLQDDSTALRLTIIGATEKQRRVLTDWQSAPELAPYRGKVLVQAYSPEEWAVTSAGLPHDGDPTILVQSCPDSKGRGKVLHHGKSYQGPAALAAILNSASVRKPNPDYKPNQDPDLSAPAPASAGLGIPTDLLPPAVVALLATGAVAAGTVLRRKKS